MCGFRGRRRRCLVALDGRFPRSRCENADSELAGAVTDMHLAAIEHVGARDEKVSGCLRRPLAGRIHRDAGQGDFSGGNVDEDEQVEAFKGAQRRR